MSMDSRVFYTKIFRDSYIRSLTDTEYRLFTYFVFNPHISQLGIYELEPEEIDFDLPSLPRDLLETIKLKFEKDKKIFFYNKWVGVANCMKYQKYSGYTNAIKQRKLIAEYQEVCEPLLIKIWGSDFSNILYKYSLEAENPKKGDTPIKGVSSPYHTHYNNNHNHNHNQVLGSAEGEQDQTASNEDDGLNEYRNNPRFLAALAEYNIEYNDFDPLISLSKLQDARNKKANEELAKSQKEPSQFALNYFALKGKIT